MKNISNKYTNNPELKFISLEGEQSRTYEFPGGNLVTIAHPEAVCIRPASCPPPVGSRHSHCVISTDKVVIYVPAGWIALRWTAKPGRKVVMF